MLERIDFNVGKISKEDYKPVHDDLVERLVVLQQKARREETGLVVLFEGWNGAGKGSRISDLLYTLDARSTSVYVTPDMDFEEADRFAEDYGKVTGYDPFMQDFWKALGPRGSITFFDRGWYTLAAQEMLYACFGKDMGSSAKEVGKKKLKKQKKLMGRYLASIKEFEKQLVDDGYVVVKFFLHISKDEQKKRLQELHDNPETSWRVSKDQLGRVDGYHNAHRFYETLLAGSDFDFAPWVLVNAEDKRRANLDVASTLVEALDSAFLRHKDPEDATAAHKAAVNSSDALADTDPHSRSEGVDQVIRARSELEATQMAALAPKSSSFKTLAPPIQLDGIDHSLGLSPEEYRTQLKFEQGRLNCLEVEMYLKRIPLLVLFEGWDAAGKGGAIKRVAQALDARAYTIFPSPAPTRPELLHPHLWRYWTRLPKAGHVGIYDRSWYGRVLVERVEGFASVKEWSRAYDEINGFEKDLLRWGALLIKFWVDVSPDEQLNRFRERELNPNKRWKITEEDWRNRDKHPQYKAAAEDMFRLTSTEQAPWVVLESDSKHFARIKALKTINDELEKRLGNR